jgi:thiopurine S-methyltransferase
MQPEFWHERWRTGQIGFHQASADRNLIRHWPALRLARGSRVFVPLCGKSLDLLWLRDQGHHVVGIDLSAIALESFLMENGIPARRRAQGDFEIYETPEFKLYCGDYFALTAADLKDVAAVYDRAALIAWNPESRPRYVEHLAALAKPGTQILLITLEYPQAEMRGPPFSVMHEEVERLYSPHFARHEIDRQDTLANEPRFRSRGLKELFEVSYRLVRR